MTLSNKVFLVGLYQGKWAVREPETKDFYAENLASQMEAINFVRNFNETTNPIIRKADPAEIDMPLPPALTEKKRALSAVPLKDDGDDKEESTVKPAKSIWPKRRR